MSHKMKALCLALVLVVAMLGVSFGTNVFYDKFKQKTDEEKRAELVSLLTSENVIDILGPEGTSAILSRLKPEDLLNLLGPQELLRIRSDGKYDYDYSLIELAGSEPASLTDRARAVLVKGFNAQGKQLFSSRGVGFIYDQEYVVAPIQLFFIIDSYGFITPSWQVPGITLKTYLLADPEKEDDWKQEEMGEIVFDEELSIAVIKRVDSIIDTPQTQCQFGKYEDISIGNVIYQLKQANGRVGVEQTSVSGLYVDEKGKNLIATQGDLLFVDLGGPFFAIRDGKPELVGLICVIKPIEGIANVVYVYVLDINQIAEFIEKKIKK